MKVNISNIIVSINKNQEKEIYKELEKNGISRDNIENLIPSFLLNPLVKKQTAIHKKEKANSWLPRGLGKGEKVGDSLMDTGSPCR